MSARLKRYEIRAEQRTKRSQAKFKALASVARSLFEFITMLPDEIKLSYSSEILMRLRSQDHQKSYAWKHEHTQAYRLLNQAIGARNNLVNTRAISKIFSVSDIAEIIRAANPQLRAYKLKASERLEFG